MAKKKTLPLWVFGLAVITDILDLLNLAGMTTIGGYAITKPLTISLNVFVFMTISAYKGYNLETMKGFVLESLPVVEYLPIATYMVFINR